MCAICVVTFIEMIIEKADFLEKFLCIAVFIIGVLAIIYGIAVATKWGII
jgi:hypothetical protein